VGDYLALLRKKYPHLCSLKRPLDWSLPTIRPARACRSRGKFGLGFFGGGLKAEGKTFKDLSPYALLLPGLQLGAPGSWLM
jgi:hypothetical protein